MTDEDRELLSELNRLGQAFDPLGFGILTDTLDVQEQLGYADQILSLGRRIRERAGTCVVVEGGQV